MNVNWRGMAWDAPARRAICRIVSSVMTHVAIAQAAAPGCKKTRLAQARLLQAEEQRRKRQGRERRDHKIECVLHQKIPAKGRRRAGSQFVDLRQNGPGERDADCGRGDQDHAVGDEEPAVRLTGHRVHHVQLIFGSFPVLARQKNHLSRRSQPGQASVQCARTGAVAIDGLHSGAS